MQTVRTDMNDMIVKTCIQHPISSAPSGIGRWWALHNFDASVRISTVLLQFETVCPIRMTVSCRVT